MRALDIMIALIFDALQQTELQKYSITLCNIQKKSVCVFT